MSVVIRIPSFVNSVSGLGVYISEPFISSLWDTSWHTQEVETSSRKTSQVSFSVTLSEHECVYSQWVTRSLWVPLNGSCMSVYKHREWQQKQLSCVNPVKSYINWEPTYAPRRSWMEHGVAHCQPAADQSEPCICRKLPEPLYDLTLACLFEFRNAVWCSSHQHLKLSKLLQNKLTCYKRSSKAYICWVAAFKVIRYEGGEASSQPEA